MNAKRFLSCKKSREESFITHFFDGVEIDDEEIKESIFDWISRLNQKGIFVNNFSYLLTKYEEIVFPIKLSGHQRNLKIVDNNGTHYYMCYNQYVDIIEYSIGKRARNFDLEFTYSLGKENLVSLKDYCIVRLNEKELNTHNQVTFYYNSKRTTTKAVLQTNLEDTLVKLEFLYNSSDYLYDTRIAMDFFNLLNTSNHIDNVFELLEYLLDNMRRNLEPKTIYTISSCIKTDLSDNA